MWLAAHEFRHLWQYRRAERAARQGKQTSKKGEYDADKFAIERLSQHRVHTGCSPIVPVKQPNPLATNRTTRSKSGWAAKLLRFG